MKIKDIKEAFKLFYRVESVGDHIVWINSEAIDTVKYEITHNYFDGVKLNAVTKNRGTFRLGHFKNFHILNNINNVLKVIEDVEKHLQKDQEYFTTASYEKQEAGENGK